MLNFFNNKYLTETPARFLKVLRGFHAPESALLKLVLLYFIPQRLAGSILYHSEQVEISSGNGRIVVVRPEGIPCRMKPGGKHSECLVRAMRDKLWLKLLTRDKNIFPLQRSIT